MHRVAVWTHDASGCSLDAWVAACHAYGCRRGLCSLLATHLPGRSPDECGDRLESLHVQMSAGAAARGSVCFCGTGRHLDGSRIPFDGSWVQCDGCQLWCHRQCTGLKPTKAACDDVECACPACTLLLTTYYLLLTPHYLLLTTWSYSLFTTHYSLLTTHYSLLTYHLPLTTYYYLLPRYACPSCSAYEASVMKRSRPSMTLEEGKEAGLCGTPGCELPDHHQARSA